MQRFYDQHSVNKYRPNENKIMKNDENAAMDMTVAFLVFAAPFAACVAFMCAYDGSATAIGHYFTALFHSFYRATLC